MKHIFTLSEDNNIAAGKAADGATFSSAAQLSQAVSGSGARLVEIWNSFAGVAPFSELKPVKKFTDVKSGSLRIWNAIQRLTGAKDASYGTMTGKHARKPKKAARRAPKAQDGRDSKKAQVLEMMRAKGGVSMAAIMKHTGWQPHTVRGFISTLGKKGTSIESFKTEDGDRCYKIA